MPTDDITIDASQATGRIVTSGLIGCTCDGTENVPYSFDISADVAAGLRDYLTTPVAWGLWVNANGGFIRDGAPCAIIAVRWGWTTDADGVAQVFVAAEVRSTEHSDAIANESETLAWLGAGSLQSIRDRLALIDRCADRWVGEGSANAADAVNG